MEKQRIAVSPFSYFSFKSAVIFKVDPSLSDLAVLSSVSAFVVLVRAVVQSK